MNGKPTHPGLNVPTGHDQHQDVIRAQDVILRGVIDAVGELVDAGEMTAEQALARIRARQAETQAAIDAVRTQAGAR